VLHNFEDFIDREVISRLQSSVFAAPRQRCSLLTVGLELEQTVVDAVKEHFVVYVLALRKQNLKHVCLTVNLCRLLFLFLNVLFAVFLPTFLECQIKVKG